MAVGGGAGTALTGGGGGVGLMPQSWEDQARIDLENRKLDLQAGHWDQQLRLYQQLFGERQKQQGGLTSIVDQYNRAFAEAKAANEAKYRQQLGLTDQATGQQQADVRSNYGQARSTALQNLARVGMGNTSVGATLSQGNTREMQSALNRVSDQQLATKLGVMQNFNYAEPNTQIPTALIQAMTQQQSWPSF